MQDKHCGTSDPPGKGFRKRSQNPKFLVRKSPETLYIFRLFCVYDALHAWTHVAKCNGKWAESADWRVVSIYAHPTRLCLDPTADNSVRLAVARHCLCLARHCCSRLTPAARHCWLDTQPSIITPPGSADRSSVQHLVVASRRRHVCAWYVRAETRVGTGDGRRITHVARA